jgi:hypothetical protein
LCHLLRKGEPLFRQSDIGRLERDRAEIAEAQRFELLFQAPSLLDGTDDNEKPVFL